MKIDKKYEGNISDYVDSLLHPKEKEEQKTDVAAVKGKPVQGEGQYVPPTEMFNLDNKSIRKLKLTMYDCILYKKNYIMSENDAVMLWHRRAYGASKLAKEVKGKIIRADKALKFMNHWNIKFTQVIIIGKVQKKGV